MTQANQADFFGEGTATPAAAPALTPDELERRRLAANQRALDASTSRTRNTNLPAGATYNPTGQINRTPQINPATGQYYTGNERPDPGSFGSSIVPTLKAIGKDPVTMGILAAPYGVLGAGAAVGGLASGGMGSIAGAAAPTAAGVPAMTAPYTMASPFAAGAAPAAAAGGVTAGQVLSGIGAAGSIASLTAAGATGAPKVRAPQVGATLAARGDNAAGGYSGGGSLQPPQSLGEIASLRDRAAQDMFAYGDSVQSRTAPSARNVSYAPAQTVTAPKLAPAAQASMGSYGAPQTVSAQQATATQAQNQAGFLGDSAARARSVADLDFGQSNESRGAQQASLGRIGSFLDSGPGPSMAQQQLRMAQEQNLGDALALARSGRGNAAGNMKMAVSENAATNAQTNQQAALLRAQEADMWQQRQLQGMGLEQSGANSMRGQDLGAAQAQGQQALSREQLAGNIDVSRAGMEQGLAQFNAGQSNQVGMQNAQLGTQAAMEQASLGNALNIAQGNAGTNVNLQNAEQTNLTSRLQGQMGLDAATSTAGLRNAVNIAQGNSNTQTSLSNLDAQLANQAQMDAQQRAMYGFGMDAYDQQLGATRAGLDDDYRYRDLAAEIAMRDADRAAGIATGNADRAQRRNAALIGGGAAVLENIDDIAKAFR